MDYSREQVMLTLAFVSYLGFAEVSSGLAGSERTYKKINEALGVLPPIKDQWQIVWGPAPHRLPLAIFDENLMFVVQGTQDPSQYAIVIRGTNPVSITNWVLQDFSIVRQTRWPYGGPANPSPKISIGTARGLQSLQKLVPDTGLPGAGSTLYQFLASEVQRARASKLTISVTGHSLGGALSPALALWLADTQQMSDHPASPPWDPGLKATLEVYPFAGPSPGDQVFASYYNSRLGARTCRVWNEFDVVPHGWEEALLRRLPTLYDPSISPGLVMRGVLWAASFLAAFGKYQQILSETPPVQGGKVCPAFGDYVEQMLYQHTGAYVELLQLLGHIDVSTHFEFDETTKSKVRQVHNVPEATRAAPGAPEDEAAEHEGVARVLRGLPLGFGKLLPKEILTDVPRLAGLVTKGLQRIYQVPASMMLTALPASMTLPTLHERGAHYQTRARGAQPGSVVNGAHPGVGAPPVATASADS